MMKCLLISSLAFCTLASAASAQIAIVDQGGEINYDGSFSFNADAGNVLVVGTYRDSGGGAYNNITFGGNEATGMIVGSRTSLFYFIVDSSGDYDIASETGSSNSGLYVWELSNVNTSIAPVESNTYVANGNPSGTTQEIVTTSDGMFVVDVVGWNVGGGNNSVTLAPAAGNDTIAGPDFEYEINLPTGGFLGGGAGTADTAGAQNIAWDITYNSTYADFNNLAYGFTAIPEPGAFALLAGVSMLGLIVIRKRR